MVEVRDLREADAEAWRKLWISYLRFYRTRADEAAIELTWRRLLEPDRCPRGLVGIVEGTIVGLAHYLFHCSTSTAADSCYLQDLFVAEEGRGRGAGRALIQAVYRKADDAGAARVYWMTQEYNSEARALYDTLAQRTSFIQYRR